MDSRGHENEESHKDISKSQIKALAEALGIPKKDIKKVIGDLIDMGILRISGPGEWEVSDGIRWQKIRI